MENEKMQIEHDFPCREAAPVWLPDDSQKNRYAQFLQKFTWDGGDALNLTLSCDSRARVCLNGALLGYTKEFIDANFDGIIEFAELQNFVDMPLKNFSSGMVARIAFAIATITEPDILIVDETLSVGDVFFQQKCEARIRHFIQSGDVTVLFVSHSMEQVERICQRAVWIEKGDLRMDGPVDEVCKAYHDQFK